MPITQIKYKLLSNRALKPNTFSKFIRYIFDNFSENEAKKMANSFIGDLGRKYNNINHGFTSTSWETACCCWTSGMAEGKNMTIDKFNEMYLIREQQINRILSDNMSINMFVVSEAVLKCLQLIELCHGQNSVLYGYNTDGIYISNPKKLFKNKKDVKLSTNKIGKAYMTDNELLYFEKHYRENMNVLDYKCVNGKGIIFNGQAGSGKTTKLCEMVKNTKNPIVLSFTNKAVENVRSKLIANGLNNNICYTFDSYFCEYTGDTYTIKNLKNKTIFIDEFSMVPNKWITKIYESYLVNNNKIYLFGDPNQCEPVENSSRIRYDYLQSKTINMMCPKVETMQYIEKSCRYDKKTHEMLKTYLKNGKISVYLKPINKKLYKNICYLHKTRIAINTKCCDQFVLGKQYVTVDFKYIEKETYKVCTNMPVIAITNIKDKQIFNSMEFVIQEIKNNNFKVNNEWYDKKQFSETFIPGFCVTVYKYQGAEINEPYNIYDVDRMDKKELYTALSRTTKLEYIHLNYKKLKNQYFNRKLPTIELISNVHNSYNNGKIYQITFDNIYIYRFNM